MSMQQTTATSEGAVPANTLREAIEVRRIRGSRFSLREAIGVVVPLTTSIAGLHASGKTFFVHPSSIDHGRAGSEINPDAAGSPPSNDRDKACLAPELRGKPNSKGGDARASVFSVGAILYELLTGELVGPGMRRPSEVVPDLPSNVEVVLGKALVADPAHRPADLGALAQALHQLAPAGSMPPPPADVSHLDHDDGFDVDVSLSMIPPPPNPPSGMTAPMAYPPASRPSGNGVGSGRRVSNDGPFTVIEAQAQSTPNPLDPTLQLAALKEQVQTDPRPRWVAIKDGMDHGPFTGVELLQQIATGTFTSDHVVRDTVSSLEKPINEWEPFAPFAGQAKINQDIKKERVALEAVVENEKLNVRYKALIGVGVLCVVGAAIVAFFLRDRGNSKANDDVKSSEAQLIAAGQLGSARATATATSNVGPGGGGGHWDGAAGTHPVVAGGMSCEAAKSQYVSDYKDQGLPPDLGSASINNGSYLNSCGVPASTAVSICAAIQNGRVVGVTVTTTPSNPTANACIGAAVRGMSFPAHPRLDIATTNFSAQ